MLFGGAVVTAGTEAWQECCGVGLGNPSGLVGLDRTTKTPDEHGSGV